LNEIVLPSVLDDTAVTVGRTGLNDGEAWTKAGGGTDEGRLRVKARLSYMPARADG
jgi:hypothetical protein